MLTPDGISAGERDQIMLLKQWADCLNNENHAANTEKIIQAGMGEPTFPVNISVAEIASGYWDTCHREAKKSIKLIHNKNVKPVESSAINYGDPQGYKNTKEDMATALTRWYQNKVTITAKNVLFTNGGAGALYIIFNILHREYPNTKIMTPFPHYTLYGGSDDIKNKLHPIQVIQEPGYRLTSKSFNKSLALAKALDEKDHCPIKVFLLCDPNNPLGTFVEEQELKDIAVTLRCNPDILIILDEAYAEMRLDGKQHLSLLCVAPDLKNRIILIRSATKAFSAAGERMAVLIAFNDTLMSQFVEKSIHMCGHTAKSLQNAYAGAMLKLDNLQLKQLTAYYQPKLEYVVKRLAEIGAAMPDPRYAPNATFYVICDLSDLLGLDLPIETKRALDKTGKIATDEDICYYLLFNDKVMIAPLSYFGLSSKKGYMRITCSRDIEELQLLMDRIATRLSVTRKIKQEIIIKKINQVLNKLKIENIKQHEEFSNKLQHFIEEQHNLITCALKLKQTNQGLNELLFNSRFVLTQSSEERQHTAAIKIQACFRAYTAKKPYKLEKYVMNEKWKKFVNHLIPGNVKEKIGLFALSWFTRNKITLWKRYLLNPNLFEELETFNYMIKLKN